MDPFFPYLGGKRRMLPDIRLWLHYYEERLACEYREPFLGAGAVFLDRIRPGLHAWINDRHTGIACLWTAVIHHPRELCQCALGATPSKKEFNRYREQLTKHRQRPDGPIRAVVEHGWQKLAVQYWGFSGLGERGSPSTRKLGAWHPARVTGTIWAAHRALAKLVLRHGHCTAVDHTVLLNDNSPGVYYLDPPYWVTLDRSRYYLFNFTGQQHRCLAELLGAMKNPWLLSYDSVPPILNLYRKWAYVRKIEVPGGYGVQGRHRGAEELLIMPARLARKA